MPPHPLDIRADNMRTNDARLIAPVARLLLVPRLIRDCHGQLPFAGSSMSLGVDPLRTFAAGQSGGSPWQSRHAAVSPSTLGSVVAKSATPDNG
jgi:hypothetical protein